MLYNTSCSHDLMAANLITSNTGEGIVIKRECSQQFSRYCTSIFSNTMEIYYGKPFDRNTGCIKKMVIEIWSALASSLYNLQKSFLHSRKDQAFSFRMSPFLWNLKKDWANTSQMKIAGRNHIFPPLSIIMEANKKRTFH